MSNLKESEIILKNVCLFRVFTEMDSCPECEKNDEFVNTEALKKKARMSNCVVVIEPIGVEAFTSHNVQVDTDSAVQ